MQPCSWPRVSLGFVRHRVNTNTIKRSHGAQVGCTEAVSQTRNQARNQGGAWGGSPVKGRPSLRSWSVPPHSGHVPPVHRGWDSPSRYTGSRLRPLWPGEGSHPRAAALGAPSQSRARRPTAEADFSHGLTLSGQRSPHTDVLFVPTMFKASIF